MPYENHHNQYSPYYQHLAVEQDGSGAGNIYQPYPYQPLSAYQSRPQQSTTQEAPEPTISYKDQGYGNVNAGNHAAYDIRNGYRDERSSVDATNLGNLAYASSLSRARTSPQQGYPRDSSSNYALNTAAPASKGNNRADSRETMASLGTNTSRDHPGTHAQYLSQGYNSSTGRSSLAQPQYATTQASHQPSWQYTSAQQLPEQPRATSGPDVGSANSRIAFQTNPSPRFPPSQNTSLQSGGQRRTGEQSQSQYAQYNSKTPVSSILNTSYPTARTQQPTAGHNESRQVGTTSGSEPSNTSNTHNAAQDTTFQSTKYHRSPNLVTQFDRQEGQESTPIQEHHPTTVDPSQVFNDYEYQRRKDEEIAKKKSAEAARSVHSATPADNQSSGVGRSGGASLHAGSSQPNDVREATRSAVHNLKEDDSSTKDQMELEMKQMLEKMRDYKAKDPSLFSRIWEQVKKGQAPQASSTKPATQRASASPTVTNEQLNSPMQSEHPSESELPTASSIPPGFDRGRFPYQRRRRGTLISSNYRGVKNHHKTPYSSQPPNTIPQSDAVPSTPAAPVAQMTSNETDQTEQRLYAAMTTFHQSLKTPTPMPNPPGQEPPPPPYDNAKRIETKPAKPETTPAQSTKPKPPKGKTKWPEHKKQALAEAAVTVLIRNPSNIGKQIRADEIHALLDQNPSYTEMCEHIESRGFVFERSHFARFLLNAVPELGMPSPATNANQPTSIPAASQLQPNGYRPPDASRMPPSLDQKQLGHNYQRLPSNQSMSNQQHVSNSGKVLAPLSSVEKPITKEDKARKRNFSDIIDLTRELSDDEDLGRYRPKSRMQQSSQNQSLDPAKMTVSRTDSSDPAASHTKKQEDPRYPLTGRDRILKELVAEPMNKRRDARRCSSYDPKTIARDILISSGKHPTMAPLNSHLEILRERFDYVNNDSDLSTFRWDIVEHSEMLSGRQIVPATLADIMNRDNGDNAEDNKAVRQPPANSTRKEPPLKRLGRPKKHLSTEAFRDAPLRVPGPTYRPQSDTRASSRDDGTKRGPQVGVFKMPTKPLENTGSPGRQQQDDNLVRQPQLSLQAHGAMPDLTNRRKKSAMIQKFAFAPEAISKVPLNAASPSSLSSPLPPSATSSGALCLRCKKQNSHCDGQKPCSRCRQEGIDAKHCIFAGRWRANLPASTEPVASVKPSSSASSPTIPSPLSHALPVPPSQKNEVVHGRKGRPPGAKNKQPRPDKGIPKGPKTASPLTSKPMRPPSRDRSTPRGSNGLRNSFSPTNSIAVVIQEHSTSVAGSETRHHNRNIENAETNATVYRPYKCWWDQCPAELHNLETFRKHVCKHRKGLEKPIPCKMPGCGHHTDEDDHGTWLTFKDEAAWDRHVEKKHILLVAKRQGEVLSGESDESSD